MPRVVIVPGTLPSPRPLWSFRAGIERETRKNESCFAQPEACCLSNQDEKLYSLAILDIVATSPVS